MIRFLEGEEKFSFRFEVVGERDLHLDLPFARWLALIKLSPELFLLTS